MFADWHGFTRRHPHVVDVALALLLYGNSFPGSMGDPDSGGQGLTRSPSAAVAVLAAVSCAALLWRRTRPRTVVVVTTAAGAVMGGLGFALSPLLIGPTMLALFSLAVRTDRRTAGLYSAGAVVVLFSVGVGCGPGPLFGAVKVGLLGWTLLPAAIGDALRSHRGYVAVVEARAELAERTREEEARQRVAEERVRIARELHDVVAHHIALANAQAGTASYLLRTRPEQAQQVLNELAGTTSSALRELKATVGLLRQNGDAEAPLEPAPGLARLPDLVASFEAMGLVVTVTVEGEARPLSPGVDLTAYRIVQEALTNVAKHAGTGAADVRLGYSRQRLTITIADEGGPVSPDAAASDATGYGLLGMRERASSVGGLLFADRRPEGGFRVTTELPLSTRDHSGADPDTGDGPTADAATGTGTGTGTCTGTGTEERAAR